jgi:hypothetical protein
MIIVSITRRLVGEFDGKERVLNSSACLAGSSFPQPYPFTSEKIWISLAKDCGSARC